MPEVLKPHRGGSRPNGTKVVPREEVRIEEDPHLTVIPILQARDEELAPAKVVLTETVEALLPPRLNCSVMGRVTSAKPNRMRG